MNQENTTEKSNSYIAGLELSRMFYEQAVKPILDDNFPALRYSAGLIGSGSEVLGFDTEMSSDHDWGPRVMIFLEEEACALDLRHMQNALEKELPRQFLGYSTNFTPSNVEESRNEQFHVARDGVSNHRVELSTAKQYFLDYLGFDISAEIYPADWLTFPEQKLGTIKGGAIFRDDIDLEKVRQRFAYYPDDVWLYLLASAWKRIEQEEHLMGRAGFVGDEIGSAIIASRLVRDLMHLCFLMEREYAPYSKWLGTAFARLKAAATLKPIFTKVLLAPNWQERQTNLSRAYEYVAQCHNQLGITDTIPANIKPFFTRPFEVISMGRFSTAIIERIADKSMKAIASRRPIGAIHQFSDNTDLLVDPSRRLMLRGLYADV
jgi:hypothetical protein